MPGDDLVDRIWEGYFVYSKYMLKNIVIINDYAHINGGAGQVALASAIGLAKRNHRVSVLAAVGPVMEALQHSSAKVIITGQCDILNDPNMLRAATQGLWNVKARKTMTALLASLDPSSTIIHIHSWTKALSSSVIRVAIKKGFRVVCTLHDYFVACPNGGFFDYQRKVSCSEEPLSIACLLKNCDARSYLQKLWRAARQEVQCTLGLIPSGINHFITISDFSETLLKPFVPRNAVVYRIENPVNIDRQSYLPSLKSDIFSYVGRLSQEKGVKLFAKAAKQMGLSPVFVGAGECEKSVKAICPKAKITGWVSSESVVEYIKASRALVLPSLWYETQGLVVAEAAALGVPAIVPDNCAARDMVTDGKTGLWFQSGNLDDLCQKMKILMDSATAEQMGKFAYDKYWQSPNTLDKHIDRLEYCYEDILHSSS